MPRHESDGAPAAPARTPVIFDRMPTIPGIPRPFRLYFYCFDCNEPPHVHVQRDRGVAKFWMTPVSVASNHGLSARDLTAARRTILEHHSRMMEAWREHCGST